MAIDKNILKRGTAVLTVKYKGKEQKYHYWDKETFEGVGGLTALGPVAAGANAEKNDDDETKQKPKESAKSSDISNVISNIKDLAQTSGWFNVLRQKYADKNGVIDIEKNENLKPIFIDDKGNFKENVDSNQFDKNVSDMKSDADKIYKSSIKQFDTAYKDTQEAIEKDDKNSYMQYVGDKFMDRWTMNNKYGCKFLGMNINPKDFAKAKLMSLAKKGVSFIEDSDWNILSTGPKIALALWKGVNFLVAVGSTIAQRRKSVQKIKKEKVVKEVNDTLKKIKETKSKGGIPE